MSARVGVVEAFALLVLLAPACQSVEEEPSGDDLPECDPAALGSEGHRIQATGLPDADDPADATVVAATRSQLRFEADPLADPPDERTLEIELGDLMPDTVRLPQLGDRVLVSGGSGCDSSGGYGRVESPTGELLFEGGNPSCDAEWRSRRWQPPSFLAARPAAGHQQCLISDCVSDVWEVTVAIDGVERVLPIGAPQQVEIDGRPYLAAAQHAQSFVPCGVVFDGDPVLASAYLAPLSE